VRVIPAGAVKPSNVPNQIIMMPGKRWVQPTTDKKALELPGKPDEK